MASESILVLGILLGALSAPVALVPERPAMAPETIDIAPAQDFDAPLISDAHPLLTGSYSAVADAVMDDAPDATPSETPLPSGALAQEGPRLDIYQRRM